MQENQPTSGFQPSNPVIGSPSKDASVFPGQQSYRDTCAIRCQEFILEQFTGTDYPEDALIQECIDNGWYVPGQGTMPYNVGNLLEAHGIPVTRYESANAFTLTAELAQGHKVIVAVDSNELAEGNSILDEIPGFQGADHAVVVSGIDTSNPDDIRVIVSDPGTGTADASYPLANFTAARQDSNFLMVATQQPAPPWRPEMVNFDYELGHIPQVGNLPFDDFLAMEQTSNWIHQVFPAEGPDLAQPQSRSSHNNQWPASIGPELALQFDQANEVLGEAQQFIDSVPQHTSADSAADESMSDARDHASKHDFDKAQSDLEEAKYHQDQADYYDPDK